MVEGSDRVRIKLIAEPLAEAPPQSGRLRRTPGDEATIAVSRAAHAGPAR